MKLSDFDMTNPDIVLAAGKLLGDNIMDEVKEVVMEMDHATRILFFTALLSTPVGCMRASIGVESTKAILDVCKERFTEIVQPGAETH